MKPRLLDPTEIDSVNGGTFGYTKVTKVVGSNIIGGGNGSIVVGGGNQVSAFNWGSTTQKSYGNNNSASAGNISIG